MKQIILSALLVLEILSHTTYPGMGSPYGSQVGMFVPQISPVQNITSAGDVIYNRFCKAVCMLYVPIEKTCGLNNEVYLNDCQARCDRISTDKARLMFNEKCCCSLGTEYVDAAWVLGTANTVTHSETSTVKSSSFCVSTSVPGTTPITGYINVFAVPPCIAECLGISNIADLKYVDNTKTYYNVCDDGIAN